MIIQENFITFAFWTTNSTMIDIFVRYKVYRSKEQHSTLPIKNNKLFPRPSIHSNIQLKNQYLLTRSLMKRNFISVTKQKSILWHMMRYKMCGKRTGTKKRKFFEEENNLLNWVQKKLLSVAERWQSITAGIFFKVFFAENDYFETQSQKLFNAPEHNVSRDCISWKNFFFVLIIQFVIFTR